MAALKLLDTLPESARVAVISFSTTADLRSGFTTDRAASRDAINALAADGGTAIYDAVALSAQQAAASGDGLSAIVLLTDGADTSSARTVDDAVKALDGVDSQLYAVFLQTGDADAAALASLTDPTGGQTVSAADPAALADVYVGLGQRIANQYQVEFQSTTEDPTADFTVSVPGTGDTASVKIALPDRAAPGTTVPPTTTIPPVLTATAKAGHAGTAVGAVVRRPARGPRPRHRRLRRRPVG